MPGFRLPGASPGSRLRGPVPSPRRTCGVPLLILALLGGAVTGQEVTPEVVFLCDGSPPARSALALGLELLAEGERVRILGLRGRDILSTRELTSDALRGGDPPWWDEIARALDRGPAPAGAPPRWEPLGTSPAGGRLVLLTVQPPARWPAPLVQWLATSSAALLCPRETHGELPRPVLEGGVRLEALGGEIAPTTLVRALGDRFHAGGRLRRLPVPSGTAFLVVFSPPGAQVRVRGAEGAGTVEHRTPRWQVLRLLEPPVGLYDVEGGPGCVVAAQLPWSPWVSLAADGSAVFSLAVRPGMENAVPGLPEAEVAVTLVQDGQLARVDVAEMRSPAAGLRSWRAVPPAGACGVLTVDAVLTAPDLGRTGWRFRESLALCNRGGGETPSSDGGGQPRVRVSPDPLDLGRLQAGEPSLRVPVRVEVSEAEGTVLGSVQLWLRGSSGEGLACEAWVEGGLPRPLAAGGEEVPLRVRVEPMETPGEYRGELRLEVTGVGEGVARTRLTVSPVRVTVEPAGGVSCTFVAEELPGVRTLEAFLRSTSSVRQAFTLSGAIDGHGLTLQLPGGPVLAGGGEVGNVPLTVAAGRDTPPGTYLGMVRAAGTGLELEIPVQVTVARPELELTLMGEELVVRPVVGEGSVLAGELRLAGPAAEAVTLTMTPLQVGLPVGASLLTRTEPGLVGVVLHIPDDHLAEPIAGVLEVVAELEGRRRTWQLDLRAEGR